MCRKMSWAKPGFNWEHLGGPQEQAGQALKVLSRSRRWFPRAQDIPALSSSVQHMVRRKTLQVELCEQLM